MLHLAEKPIAAQEGPGTSPPAASATSGALLHAQAPHAAPPNSDVLAYWYGASYRTPFVTNPVSGSAANIARNAVEFTHAGFWSKGSNFADLTISKSNMAEPASGGGDGAVEAYFIWRSNIGLNAISHTRTFRVGPLRDIAVELGTNLEVKNSSFSPAEKTIYFGPNLQFALHQGYFNLGLHLRKEWNHEAVLGKADLYDPDFNIEPTWMLPFAIGKVHMAYTGFADYNSPKGLDSFGSQTVNEFLIRSYLVVDLGGLFGKPQLIDLNGGLWYWKNEYGKAGADPGARQMTPIFGIALHLDRRSGSHSH